MIPSRLVRRLGLLVALAAAYFVTGKLGLRFALVNPSASAVWAPTGIALAAFLLQGYAVWPAIFLGAFLLYVTTSGSVATAIAIAAGNTLEGRSEEHTSELQSHSDLVCRLLLEKKKT